MTNSLNLPDPASPDVRTGHPVLQSRIKLAVLLAFGFSAPLWWTWLASQAAYRIYVVGGSPIHPSHALVWWSVLMPSLLLGLTAGTVVTLILRASLVKGWLVFWGSLLVGTVVLGRVAPSDSLASLFSSAGNWIFLAGSLVWPVANHLRRRG